MAANGTGGIAVNVNKELDLFGQDMQVLVAMLANVLDNEPVEWQLSPIDVKASGKFQRITASMDMFPITTNVKTNVSVNEENFELEANLEVCIEVSVGGTGRFCFAGRCVDVPSNPVNLVLDAVGEQCVTPVQSRKLRSVEDLWKLESELYETLKVNQEVPVRDLLDKVTPFIYSAIVIGSLLLLLSACAAGVVIYLTEKKVDGKNERQAEETDADAPLSWGQAERHLEAADKAERHLEA